MMPRDYSDYSNGWRALANAIVLKAIEDYRSAKKHLDKAPFGDRQSEIMMQSVKNFIRSDWFALLTNVDSEWMRETLDNERLR